MANPVHQVNDKDGSIGDTCGFMLHVLIVLVAIASSLSQLQPPSVTALDGGSYAKQVRDLFPDRSVGAIVVRILLGALAAIPLVYFVVNQMSVPALDSIDTLCDDYTRTSVDGNGMDSNGTSSRNEWRVPVIADIDVGRINDAVWQQLSQQERYD